MCHILGRCAQEVFKLDGAELFNDSRLLRDALLEAILEFMKLTLLLVKVLDQTTASLLHFVQSSLQADPERSDILLTLSNLVIGVLRVPDVVSDELLQLGLPG